MSSEENAVILQAWLVFLWLVICKAASSHLKENACMLTVSVLMVHVLQRCLAQKAICLDSICSFVRQASVTKLADANSMC